MNITKMVMCAMFTTCFFLKSESSDLKNEHNLTIEADSHVETPYNPYEWKMIEETYQATCDLTGKIIFCLQQAEQILNAGKMKFQSQHRSKKDLLEEIKHIKFSIEMISQDYAKNLTKDQAIVYGAMFNYSFLSYILPIVETDISLMSAADFEQHLQKSFETLASTIQSNDQIFTIMEENEQFLKKLMIASDNIGLTTLNKIYRYLDTKQIPWYGKSIIATAWDAAFWTSIGTFTYALTVYCIGRNWRIPFSYIEMTDNTLHDNDDNDGLKYKLKLSEKERYYAKIQEFSKINSLTTEQLNILTNQLIEKDIESGKIFLNSDNQQLWRRKTTEEFFSSKAFLGDFADTEFKYKTSNSEYADNKEEKYGIFSYPHEAILQASSSAITYVVGALVYLTRESFFELKDKCIKKYNALFNYYIKGDATGSKNNQDFTKAYFKDFVGAEHLEQLAHELADYLKNPTRYERSGIAPSTGYLLVGPSQTGKSYFAKALKTLIDEEFGSSGDTLKFAIVTQDDMEYFKGFANLFYWARKLAPMILFIDEIDMFDTRRATSKKNTQELLTAMNGIETDPSKKIIVIAATNRPEEIDFALKEKGRFSEIISFYYPTYQSRQIYINKQLTQKNITLSQDMIDIIAQETDQQTFNMIDMIIKHALRIATYQTRPVTEADFEIALDREIRKITPVTATISEQEAQLVALYHAGHAVAHHILKINQQIVKITINPVDKPTKSKEGNDVKTEQIDHQHENYDLLQQTRSKQTRLGSVFTISSTNNHELISAQEQEKQLLALLAGQAALELIMGSQYPEFGKEDRALVIDTLERKIAQGTPVTENIRLQALAEKEDLYQNIKAQLKDHIQFITLVSQKLIEIHTIDQKQWHELSSNYNNF